MIPNGYRETLRKAVDNAIEEITSHYQMAWSTPPEKIERALREDTELNKLIDVRWYLETLPQAPEQWVPVPDNYEDEYIKLTPDFEGAAFWISVDPEKNGDFYSVPLPDDVRLCKRQRPET